MSAEFPLAPSQNHRQPGVMRNSLAVFLALTGVLITQAANPPTAVLVRGEDEYHSAASLPAFAKFLETNYALKTVYLERQKPGSISTALSSLRGALLANAIHWALNRPPPMPTK